jgi:hypothetical protein
MAGSWGQAVKTLLQKIESPRAAGAKLARTIDWSGLVPGRINVLCLERSQFIKDIEELRRLTDISFVTLNAVRLKRRQEVWVPEGLRQQAFFSSFLKEDRCRQIRATLTEFGSAILTEARRHGPIDAVASANIDYWQDETMKLGCNALGIPFLVLCRENHTIPWTSPWKHEHIAKSKFRFEGAGTAVFSQATKDAYAPAFGNTDDLWITGAPRYDRWLDLKPLPDSAKDHVSLVTFNDPGYAAVNVFTEVARVFEQVARAESSRGLTWLVKCKKKGDRDETLERLGQVDAPNLRFEYETPLFELFPRSRAVVGYNSLALLEAMLTDAPVVIPCWGETRPPRQDVLLDYNDPLTRRVASFAATPEELRDLLIRAARGEKLKTGTAEERRALFAANIHVPEKGTASRKVQDFIAHYVARARRREADRKLAS